jgi:hypothetical protein
VNRRPGSVGRVEGQPGEVVRRGAHVELADVPRQLEAVGDQLEGMRGLSRKACL